MFDPPNYLSFSCVLFSTVTDQDYSGRYYLREDEYNVLESRDLIADRCT